MSRRSPTRRRGSPSKANPVGLPMAGARRRLTSPGAAGPAHGDRQRGARRPRPPQRLRGMSTATGSAHPARRCTSSVAARCARTVDTDVRAALRSAERDPGGAAPTTSTLRWPTRRDAALDALAALADRFAGTPSATTSATSSTATSTSPTSATRDAGSAPSPSAKGDADAYTLSIAEVADRAWEAHDDGATEVCMQGGIHPDLPGTAYVDLVPRGQGAGAAACTCTRSRRWRSSTARPDRLEYSRVAVGGEGRRARHHSRHGGRDPRRRGALGAHQGQAADVLVDRGGHAPRTGSACGPGRR